MPLRQLFTCLQPVVNGQGQPLPGAQVKLTVPGTQTPVTGYSDSGLVNALPAPIKASGTGRLEVWVAENVDVRVCDRHGNFICQQLSANPDALGASESGGLINNGSFETDTDSDGIPDDWDLTSETGSTNQLDNTDSTDGSNSFKFISTGNGGGNLVTDDFFPVNDVDNLQVNVDLKSSVTGVRNIIRLEWYDISKVLISNSDIYDSTANPLTWTSQNLSATPPAGARFGKLRLIGIDPSVAIAGSTWFDRCSVFYPAVVGGTFDNLTLTGNTIRADNTNGDVVLQPNGTGSAKTGNLALKDNTISAQNTDGDMILAANGDGDVILTTPGTGAVKTDNLSLKGNTVAATNANGDLYLETPGTGRMRTDNLALSGNTIQSTNTNGDIIMDPDGTGKLMYNGLEVIAVDPSLIADATGAITGSTTVAGFGITSVTQVATGDFNVTFSNAADSTDEQVTGCSPDGGGMGSSAVMCGSTEHISTTQITCYSFQVSTSNVGGFNKYPIDIWRFLR